jgi:hypothetical protein
MKIPFDPADRKILLMSACLLVLLTVVALMIPNAGEEQSRGFPSSYDTSKEGAKAAYELLEETGYRVEHWTQSPAELPSAAGSTVLIVAGPTLAASSEETIQLRQFVQRGGRVLVTGMPGAALIGVKGVAPVPAGSPAGFDEGSTFAAEQPAPLTRQAPAITMESSVRWVDHVRGQQRYYGSSDGAVVVKFPIGHGEVIWWAGDSPLTNFGITKASNLALFLNSVGSPGPTRVLWDEYFHGVRKGLWQYLGRTPLPWALLQLLLFAILIICTFGRRSGPIRALARESRLSPLEFVETLGALYERRGEAAGALEIAFSHFRFLLSRRLGTPSAATSADLVRTMQNRPGLTLAGFAVTMEHIESALKLKKVAEPKALAWIGELHDFAVRLGLET